MDSSVEFRSDGYVAQFRRMYDEGKLTKSEYLSGVFVILFAGHETTIGLISNTLALLTSSGGLSDDKYDFELLRKISTPVVFAVPRTANVEQRIGEILLLKGDRVFVSLLDTLNFSSDNGSECNSRSELVFGHGMHYCIGAELARMEHRVAINSLVESRIKIPAQDWSWTLSIGAIHSVDHVHANCGGQ